MGLGEGDAGYPRPRRSKRPQLCLPFRPDQTGPPCVPGVPIAKLFPCGGPVSFQSDILLPEGRTRNEGFGRRLSRTVKVSSVSGDYSKRWAGQSPYEISKLFL